MSGHDPSGSESQRLEALAKHIAELERQTIELRGALQRSASVRRMLVLVVAATLGIFGYLYYTTGRSFTDKENLDRLTRELQARAESNTDRILKEIQLLVENTQPAVSSALADQFKKDFPVIMELLGGERDTLAVNVQSRLDDLVRAKYAKSIDQHRTILQEEFPGIKDENDLELMVDNLKDSFEPLVKQYYGEKLKAEFARLYKTWDDFPLDKSNRNREELSAELYQLLFALMQHKLAAGGEEPATPKQATKAGGS